MRLGKFPPRVLLAGIYAAQAMNRDAESRAREIRIRAEDRAGQLLDETAKNEQRKRKGFPSAGPGRGKKNKNNIGSSDNVSKSLDQFGISPDQSSQWQKLHQARIKLGEEKFEELVKDPHTSTEEIIRKSNPTPVPVCSPNF